LVDGSLSTSGITSFDEAEYAQYLVDKQAVIDTFDQSQAIKLVQTRLNKTINT
jgi:hypothetical protein